MDALLSTVRALKLWQIATLVAILAGAFGASYGIYIVATSSSQQGLGDNQRLIAVTRGDLVNQVSTDGNINFPTVETLTFGSSGTVSEVLVEEGQRVEAGQPLARLDAATVAALETAVAQARLTLQSAQDALDQANDPHSDLDMAQAEADVANVRQAIEAAKEALETAINGPTEAEMAKAQAQVDSTAAALTRARDSLKLSRKEWEAKIEAAQETSDVALEAYQQVYQGWLGIEVTEDESDQDPDSLLASWGADLYVLFGEGPGLRDLAEGWPSVRVPVDDSQTPWDELTIYTWLTMYPGTIAPTCEDGVAPYGGLCIKTEMDDAWDVYTGARDNLDTIEIQASNATSNADTEVFHAEESLEATQEALTELQAGPDSLDIEVKATALEVAKATLAKDEDTLAELGHSVDPLEVGLREAELKAAQIDAEAALQRLEEATLKSPMAGVVSAVHVETGESVGAGTPAIDITDPTVVEVDGVVDEVDVLFLRVGSQVSVTLDALPNQVLQGTVSSIAAAAQTQQGVVSYPLRIQLVVPVGIQLVGGLSATARIVLREEQDVLLIPQQVVYGTFEEPLVRVMRNGRIQEQQVVLGSSDNFWVVASQGLVEGDQIVMETGEAATTQFGFRPGPGGFGGGFGGGGFRRG